MKKQVFSIIALAALVLGFLPATKVSAGECCGCDPIYDRDLRGEVVISAYVRNTPCMEGSTILKTVVKGSVIKVIGETDGWYKVELVDGTVGWVGQVLMQITSKALTNTSGTTSGTSGNSASAAGLAKYIGYIFLAVEKHGEAYYYYPVNKKGYYLGRPADAFSVMRTLGLGATHEFIHNTTYFPSHVVGRILLDVESHGEAYYIYPKDRKKYYLGRPDDAFRIMRELGLGISNTNLTALPLAE
ncbi:MAG: SH3 domain-containing protein [Patescibacteria group bacterium]